MTEERTGAPDVAGRITGAAVGTCARASAAGSSSCGARYGMADGCWYRGMVYLIKQSRLLVGAAGAALKRSSRRCASTRLQSTRHRATSCRLTPRCSPKTAAPVNTSDAMLSDCYSDLVPETGERLCCYDDVEDAAPRLPSRRRPSEAADRLVVGDAAGVVWEINGGAKSALETHHQLADAPLTSEAAPPRARSTSPRGLSATGGRPWAVARCVRGTRNGDVLLVGAARRDVCVRR